MPEVFAAKPHSAEGGIQSQGLHFLPVNDASSFDPEPDPRPPSGEPPSVGVAASNLAKWTKRFYSLEGVIDVAHVSLSGGIFLSAAEAQFVRQIREDIEELGQSVLESPQAVLCTKFVEDVGLALAEQHGTRSSAFVDDDGTVALVAHSRPLRRQVTFECHAAGNTITTITIDEHMKRIEQEHGIGDAKALRKVIEWLSRS